MKRFYPVKDTFKRMKRKKKMEKILANHISDKGFLYRLYKELSKFNKKTNNPVFKNGQTI